MTPIFKKGYACKILIDGGVEMTEKGEGENPGAITLIY